MSFYFINPDGLKLLIYAQPGAKKTTIDGFFGERLKIKIGTPPVDGKANKELIRFLAEEFSLSKSRVLLLKGDKSRLKEICLVADDVEVLELLRLLKLQVSFE